MKRTLTTLVLAALISAAPVMASAQSSFAPVTVVNDKIITHFDLDQRTRYIATLVNAPVNDQVRARALQDLVDQRLKIQAAETYGVTPSDSEIDGGWRQFASDLGTTPDALRGRLNAAGVADETIRRGIAADVGWINLIRGRFGSRAAPTEAEIDAEIALVGNSTGQQAETYTYTLSQLVIPLASDAPEETRAVARAQAEEARDRVASCTDVEAVKSDYAAGSGPIGSGQLSQLPPPIAEALASATRGFVTAPIRVDAGYTVVVVCDRTGGPSQQVREQVRSTLANSRIERFAEGYLQDLRRNAVVEQR